MTTHEERQRLSAMANCLRPDWPLKSLYTLLTDDEVLVKRAYRDVATALAWVATDPDTRTPARLAEPGPWWGTAATSLTKRTQAHPPMCQTCHTPHDPGKPCDTAPLRERTARPDAYAVARQALRLLDIDKLPEEGK